MSVPIITVDFETFYSKDYTLSKMTTEEYIRDPQFEVIGVSVSVDDSSPKWFSGTKEQTSKFLSQFEWGKAVCIAHNAMFDMSILKWHFNITPLRIVDTLSMARAVHSGLQVGGSLSFLANHYGLGVKGTEVVNALGKRRLDFTDRDLTAYGKYCDNDVSLTRDLFYRLAKNFPLLELQLIDTTIRMFSEPVLQLNPAKIEFYIGELAGRKEEALNMVSSIATAKELSSNPKFANVLRTLGVEPPTKISLTTGKVTYAFAKTDKAMQDLANHPDIRVQAVISARTKTKSTIEETRAARFGAIAYRGPMPVPLKYYAARTGRWGGTDKINLQNLSRGSILKYTIEAPDGHIIIDTDSCQIEARTLAWLAGQDDLVEVFVQNNREIAEGVPKAEHQFDPYKIMASSLYQKGVDSITPEERFVGKTTILGCGYGMGAERFKDQLRTFGVEIDLEVSQTIIDIYRAKYPRIPALWKTAQKVLGAMIGNRQTVFGVNGLLKVHGRDGIELPNGLFMRYADLRWEQQDPNKGPEFIYDEFRSRASATPTRIYGGKLVENVCQALARIIIGQQMVHIAKKYRPIMTVHDAVAIVAPESEAQAAQEWVSLCMRTRPNWCLDLPLECESGMGKSYGDCK